MPTIRKVPGQKSCCFVQRNAQQNDQAKQKHRGRQVTAASTRLSLAPYAARSVELQKEKNMRYGTVYLRCQDIYAALQCVQDIVGSGGSCYYKNYSQHQLKEPEKTDNGFRIDIPSTGGYYNAVEITTMEPGVFQIVVLGSDYGSAGSQDRLGKCLVENLKKQIAVSSVSVSIQRT